MTDCWHTVLQCQRPSCNTEFLPMTTWLFLLSTVVQWVVLFESDGFEFKSHSSIFSAKKKSSILATIECFVVCDATGGVRCQVKMSSVQSAEIKNPVPPCWWQIIRHYIYIWKVFLCKLSITFPKIHQWQHFIV